MVRGEGVSSQHRALAFALGFGAARFLVSEPRIALAAIAALAMPASTLSRECDMERGANVFLQCAACHTYVTGNQDKSGPSLFGIFGRKAGAEKYSAGYSDAMRSSGIVWSSETLDAFLQMPARAVPGTKMVYIGLRDPADRAALLCFLEQKTRGS